MKLLVYVLAALLIISSVRAQDSSNREDLSISDLENNPEAREALKHGINWIFWKAAEKYDISDLNIDVTKVNQIQTWQENDNNYYFFDVQAENDDAYVNSTYNVRCLSNGEFRVVNDWSYTIDRKHSDEEQSGNYDDNGEIENPETNVEIELEIEVENPNRCYEGEEVDSSEVNNNSDLRAALEHGIAWIFEKANEKFGISNSVIVIKGIELICTWEKDGNTYWHFEVEATNDEDDIVDSSFNVKAEADSGDLRVVNEWSYDIPNLDAQPEESETYNENTDIYQDNNEQEMEVNVIYNTDDDNADDNNGNDNNNGNDDNNDDNNDGNNDDNNDGNNDDNNDDNNDSNDDDVNIIYPDNNDDNNDGNDDNNDDSNNDNNDDNNDNNGDDVSIIYPDNNDDNNDNNNDNNDNNNDDNNNDDNADVTIIYPDNNDDGGDSGNNADNGNNGDQN